MHSNGQNDLSTAFRTPRLVLPLQTMDGVITTLRSHSYANSATWRSGVVAGRPDATHDPTCVDSYAKLVLYVNVHENGLHPWRPVGVEIATPPKELVG
jgi:hypothetical protein